MHLLVNFLFADPKKMF